MENKSSQNTIPSSFAVSLTVSFCIISALFIYLIYSENLVFGSKIGNWVYPYFKTANPIHFWIPLTVLVLTGALVYLGSRLIQRNEKITLLGCFLVAVAIQIILQKIYPYSLGQLIKSDTANSFYTPALEYSTTQLFSQYTNILPSLPVHAQSNMPGKILFYQFLLRFTPSVQRMGYLIIAFSSLGGLFLYGICKRLFQDYNTALYAFVLYVLIPGKQLFLPMLNTVTPLLILICLFLFIVYLDTKKKRFLTLLGIMLYLQLLFEPSPLVMGILFIGIFVQAIGQKRISIKEFIHILLIPTISFLSTYLFFFVVFRFNMLHAFQYVIKDATAFNIKAERVYGIWLLENPKEFFFAAGLPIIMIFIYLVISMFSQRKWAVKNILHWPIENLYTFSLILTFCSVLFLGVNRGEITRLWIYLAVFFQVPAALFLAKQVRSNSVFFLVVGTLIAQSLVTLQRVGFVIP